MDIDVLVIVEEIGENGQYGLFLNPVGPSGEVEVSTEVPGCRLSLGGFSVPLDPARPTRFRTSPGRHRVELSQPGSTPWEIQVHCDVYGDDLVRLHAFEHEGETKIKLVARPEIRDEAHGRLVVGFQTQPQGLEATLMVRQGSGKPERLDLPRSRPFSVREFDLEEGVSSIEVRLDPKRIGSQTGGTDQVDIIVEWPIDPDPDAR